MSRQRTILLVEDDSKDAELTRIALAKSGLSNQVVVVEDGQQALDYLRREGAYGNQQIPDTPTVVLLDLNLPKVSGLDLLRAIRADQRLCRLPVVILTGSQDEEDICTGYRLGVNSYVRKPVGFKEFQTAIENISLYWLLVNEPNPSVEFVA